MDEGCDKDHCGDGGNKKSQSKEEVQVEPHPVKEQLPDVQYCINSPPPWR